MNNNLRNIVAQKGLTINRLAKISGVYSQDLYLAFNGNKPFYPKWRKKVAEALEMSEEELFTDDE